MALNPLTVRLEKPQGTLANTMSEVREWLDRHKIQPARFNIETTEVGIALDIRFQAENEANLFQKSFV